MNNQFQDWTPVVFNKKEKKSTNYQNPEGTKLIKKLESDEPPKLEKYSIEQINKLKNLRIEKNITQKDLANLLNIDSKIITNIENGSSTYNKKLYTNIIKKLELLKIVQNK